jgi:hypothetical protein
MGLPAMIWLWVHAPRYTLLVVAVTLYAMALSKALG